MSKKSGNIFEQHIDKVVFAVMGIICLWLLIVYVVGNPGSREYAGQKVGPGNVDNVINQKVKELDEELGTAPKSSETYKSKAAEFIAKLDSALSDINDKLFFALPNYGGQVVKADRVYSIPVVGRVINAESYYLRAVAYVPTGPVNPETDYAKAQTTLDDIDLVSVQAAFDGISLAKAFYESFSGPAVQENWRKAQFGKPVFAGVDLQRQQLGEDGSWGQWQSVPRSQIDYLKQNFNVPQKVQDLKLNMEILLVQFDKPEMKTDLLQPYSYDFAYPAVQWMPPKYYKEYLMSAKEEQRRQERETREQQKPRRQEPRDTRRAVNKPLTTEGVESPAMKTETPAVRSRQQKSVDRRNPQPTRPAASQRSAAPGPAQKAELTPQEKFEAVKLNADGNMKNPQEPIVFWAIDDNPEPGKTCRYRIRIGVFNPIAGTSWFRDKDMNLKDDVVLWSDFSDVTEGIQVPARQYFFPKTAREADKAVTFQISKYLLGKWYSKDFIAKPGETVGKFIPAAVDPATNASTPDIDYNIGLTLVDVVPSGDWEGTNVLVKREYPDILYTIDGSTVKHLAGQEKSWPDELKSRFREIKQSESEVIELAARKAGSLNQLNRQQGLPVRGQPIPLTPEQQGQQQPFLE